MPLYFFPYSLHRSLPSLETSGFSSSSFIASYTSSITLVRGGGGRGEDAQASTTMQHWFETASSRAFRTLYSHRAVLPLAEPTEIGLGSPETSCTLPPCLTPSRILRQRKGCGHGSLQKDRKKKEHETGRASVSFYSSFMHRALCFSPTQGGTHSAVQTFMLIETFRKKNHQRGFDGIHRIARPVDSRRVGQYKTTRRAKLPAANCVLGSAESTSRALLLPLSLHFGMHMAWCTSLNWASPPARRSQSPFSFLPRDKDCLGTIHSFVHSFSRLCISFRLALRLFFFHKPTYHMYNCIP